MPKQRHMGVIKDATRAATKNANERPRWSTGMKTTMRMRRRRSRLALQRQQVDRRLLERLRHRYPLDRERRKKD